jgi:hypothetical protein
MKVSDIIVNEDGESVNAMVHFKAEELQVLLQLGLNVSAAIGLNAERKATAAIDRAQHQGLND